MKLAAWNCHSGGLAKWKALETAEVTVGVVSETTVENPRPDAALVDPPLFWVSEGKPTKALAIVSPEPLQPLGARAGQGRFSVAARTNQLSILGIWSCPEVAGGGRAYEDEVLATLSAWADDLAAGDMVVAGDFNMGHPTNPAGQKPWLSRAQALWTDIGLVSAYHVFTGEEISRATRATYYHQYQRAQGWHIDWVLIHRCRLPFLRSVTVGGYDEWTAAAAPARSDHVPVIVDLDC
jgi:hypothetical protein